MWAKNLFYTLNWTKRFVIEMDLEEKCNVEKIYKILYQESFRCD